MDRTCRSSTWPAAAVLAAAVALGAAFAGPRTAALAADEAELAAAQANSRWLGRQLAADGTLQNPNGGILPDHGLMIDALFAMRASGEGARATKIVDYLDGGRHASDYFTWDGLVPGMGYDQVIVGGATAKVLVAAEASGRDPRGFGGYDMVAETKGAIMRSGPDKGRISDYSKNPDLSDSVSNNANVFGQALGVIGLAGVGENDRLAIDTLLTQQCSEGYFRIFFGYVPTEETGDHVTSNGYKVSSCDEGKAFDQSAPDGDATGLSLSALLAARKAGADGLDEPIAKAVAWLKANQKPGGGWGGGVSTEAPNTNSTGLIVQALAEAGGAGDAVAGGTAYLRSAQATAADDSGTGLADQIGAIAYTPEEYQKARSGGIAGLDSWIRAGAQASLGLSKVGFYDLTKGRTPEPGKDPGSEPSPDPTGPPTSTPTPTPTATGPKPGGGGGLPPPRPRPGAGKTPPGKVKPPSERAGSKAPPPRSTGGGTVVPPTQSQAQQSTATPAGRLGAYLAGRLVDGDHVETAEGGKTYVDYDATADLVLALRALDEQPVAITRASRFLLDPASVKAYAYGVPYEQGPAAYAEPLAKLQIIGRFLQAEPAAPSGIAATVGELGRSLAGLRDGQGRFTDKGFYGDSGTSVRRHAWAVLATTAGAAPGEAAAPLEVLLKSQCRDGTFPANLGGTGCATGDLAATAAAVVAVNGQARTTPAAADLAAAAQGTRAPVAAQVRTRVNGVPAGWSSKRVSALTSAVAALSAKSAAEGVVRGPGNAIDPILSTQVATGRQAAGLDVSTTTRALSALVLTDGGLAKPTDRTSDGATSIAAAPGVAGRSWLSAWRSPLTPALSLPVADETPFKKVSDDSKWTPPIWLLAGFALVVAAAGAAAWLVFGRGPAPRTAAPHGPPPPATPPVPPLEMQGAGLGASAPVVPGPVMPIPGPPTGPVPGVSPPSPPGGSPLDKQPPVNQPPDNPEGNA
ncbi:hypothetical protein ACFOY4_41560 [Actinomadura syzygii]|uniref:Terpene cyclase/mutase family protein n=1 Tax=Actinomadura syzygii TaxID=1427538 RepID=A0A5D0TP16_9ACTN|nr:hypothetical protein [Actinomadura syzygii]TYC07604.1 hypothetical protein FXF65_42160 [Actinomadura syzygii]